MGKELDGRAGKPGHKYLEIKIIGKNHYPAR